MVSRKRSKRNNNKRGGSSHCAGTPMLKTNDCLGEPDVSAYIHPCKNLTENQFGMKVGGSRKKKSRRQNSQKRKQRGAGTFGGGCGCAGGYDDFFKMTGGSDCGAATPSCMGVGNNVNLGKETISDGGVNDLPSPSELAWFFRNTYGATPSSNLVGAGRRRRNSRKKQQRGGHASNHNFGLDEKIGGLPRVDNQYDIYPPSTSNVVVKGPLPQDMVSENVISYGLRNQIGDVQPALEDSNLTRNSFQLEGGRKRQQKGGSSRKRNYLTRKTRNHLFGGTAANFPGEAFPGEMGDFSADMATRKFDCHQPNWCAKCT